MPTQSTGAPRRRVVPTTRTDRRINCVGGTGMPGPAQTPRPPSRRARRPSAAPSHRLGRPRRLRARCLRCRHRCPARPGRLRGQRHRDQVLRERSGAREQVEQAQPAIKEQASELQREAEQQATGETAPGPADFSGTWTSDDGFSYVIEQFGDQAVLTEFGFGGMATGFAGGPVDGSLYTFDFQAADGSFGTGSLELDGDTLDRVLRQRRDGDLDPCRAAPLAAQQLCGEVDPRRHSTRGCARHGSPRPDTQQRTRPRPRSSRRPPAIAGTATSNASRGPRTRTGRGPSLTIVSVSPLVSAAGATRARWRTRRLPPARRAARVALHAELVDHRHRRNVDAQPPSPPA